MEPDQWHYAELRVHPNIAPPEDGGVGSVPEYFSTLTVDGEVLSADILIPSKPSMASVLYIGGLGCPSATSSVTSGSQQVASAGCSADPDRFFKARDKSGIPLG